MTTIERNGLSGLCLRVAVIALAAIAFGCAPKAQTQAETGAPIVLVAR
ncbi:MAG: hypothetical protein Q8R02_11985 [Hyphomonadaceae bacterium]|nr:hypothetical protein [Hyphomonadaceae bacterium]